MSRVPDRSYSFDDNDEASLSAYRNAQHPQYYQDSPSQDLPESSPPRYRPYLPAIQDSQAASARSYPQQPNVPYNPYSEATRPLRKPYVQPRVDTQAARDLGYTMSTRTASTVTPGMDNLGAAAAGGGIAGIALGVANTNDRDSGLRALEPSHSSNSDSLVDTYTPIGTDTPYVPEPPYLGRTYHENGSYSSTSPLGASAAPVGHYTPDPYGSGPEIQMNDIPPDAFHGPSGTYTDNPYNRYSSAWDPRVGHVDIYPDEIEDDGDDGIGAPPSPHRISMLGFGASSSQSLPKSAAMAPAAAGGALGSLGGTVVRKPVGTFLTPSGNYRPISGQGHDANGEKSEYLKLQASRRKRLRWIFGILATLILAGIIVGAVFAGVRDSKTGNSTSGTGSQIDNGSDFDANSPEVKALLNNPNLHRVFPGMDYTPFNAQYPACLTDPPSQDNVTMDVAVLSQLTKTIRLYGTDCNQTEMVLYGMKQLGLTDMKVWLGVWLDNNDTTNARGMAAMYNLIETNGVTPFAGVIIGNEVLYRKDMTETQLADIATGVKSNFTAKSINLPVAISDLGTSWNAQMVDAVDVVMSNIHPFFGGVPAAQAAGWTWDFWQNNDVVLTQGTSKTQIIAETGWPSAGGNDCGAATCTSDTEGSVAGIDEMNTYMADFVCQSLTNGTTYFW
jgi:exo-beta-1,3-glucanase (GH17 family)